MIDPAVVLALALALDPRGDPARRDATVAAVAQAADSARDAAVLLAVDWHETGLGRATRAPRWGLLRARARLAGQPLAAWARASLAVWRAGRALCGAELGAAFRYHARRCVARVRGHSRAFRRAGRAALPYARRVVTTITRLSGSGETPDRRARPRRVEARHRPDRGVDR